MSETIVRTCDGREFIMPSAEENARIHAAALADTDAEPLTDEQLAKMRPAREVMSPKLFEALTQFHLDDDLIRIFRSTGDGWQERVNAALRQFLREHPLSASPH
ncbi:MAG: BrnA antitoxin family protein [Betaproteobacteria bacterium]|nr:BrnA antitoxin family protein [Betaproteobacteria bacterium]